MNEITFGRWKVVRSDSLNYRLFELKEIKKGDRVGEVDYVGLPNYFGSFEGAVRFARDREFDSGDYNGYLDGAVDELRKLNRKFVRDVRKAVYGG